MLATRYECKYLIPPAMVSAIRRYMQPFVEPDAHAAHIPDHTYGICSLYLDSADLRLYREGVSGFKNRYKLRVRSYGDGDSDPVFFEIKKRMNGMVYKRRACLERASAHGMLEGLGALASGRPLPDFADVAEFALLSRAGKAVPVVKVRYMREAYDAPGPEPVRITFDTDLCAAFTHDTEITFARGPWERIPLPGVVLELKFTERFPPWVGDLIQTFELQKESVSKYVNSMADRVSRGLFPQARPYLA